MKLHSALSCIGFGLVTLLPLTGDSQEPLGARAANPSVADFGFADLMNLLVQPRHIKLHHAGAQRNWELAAAESRNLRASFARIAQRVPKYLGNDVAEVERQMVEPRLQAIDKAIAAADPKQFAGAYADLTAACNECHVYMEHPFVIIQVPATSAADYSDQDFRPNP